MEDRIESFPPRDAFITLKDHKENFRNHPKCRLINPTKSEIGKISKQLLDSIIVSVRKQSGLNQDDGLAILRNASGPDAERVRKKVTQFF